MNPRFSNGRPQRPFVTAWAVGVVMTGAITTGTAQGQTTEEQLKQLQAQVSLLQQQIQLSVLQQTEQSKIAQGLADAAKAQVTSESDLAKAQAQAEFAKLAGIKAGLDSVGAPPGKEGKLTITTGTAGALLLNLKQPMLEGLQAAAKHVAAAARANSDQLNGGVVLATDEEIRAALQSEVTTASIVDVTAALDASISDVQGAGVTTSSLFATAAAAGLVLKTVTDLSKFFRADRTLSVFDAGEEANQVLRLLLERELIACDVRLVKLDDISPDEIVALAQDGQKTLNALAVKQVEGAMLLGEVDKLPAGSPNRPSADKVDRLKRDVAVAKELLDGLHPARKPDAFWAYVGGRYKHKRMHDAQGYRARITASAKAQTVQIIESRVFRSDKIYGTAGAQVDYRIVDSKNELLASGIVLWSSKHNDAVVFGTQIEQSPGAAPAQPAPAPPAPAIAAPLPTS